MAGIYIHIPFCRQACHYCDFHFSTNLKTQDEMVNAICQEIIQRSGYVSEKIETIYFGGGTPSLLSHEQLRKISETIKSTFDLSNLSEVTLEANPEDLDIKKSQELKELGINRLSIGFQTFDNGKLNWMNRAHNSEDAEIAFQSAREAGFDNISIDLIYALPNAKNDQWNSDLNQIFELNPDHISLYGLTIEDKTVFGKRKKEGKLVELPEDDAAEQYLHAIEALKDQGFEHYEVSNFGKPGFHSKHNNSYWSGVSYLGVGPGAHSFNGKSRQFNVRHNARYIKATKSSNTFFEIEDLTETQRLNEQILTGLRRAQGINFEDLKAKFDVDLKTTYSQELEKFQNQDLIVLTNASIRLTTKGFLVADDIALQLFFDFN